MVKHNISLHGEQGATDLRFKLAMTQQSWVFLSRSLPNDGCKTLFCCFRLRERIREEMLLLDKDLNENDQLFSNVNCVFRFIHLSVNVV